MYGNMESQKLASGAKENMLNTSLNEKLSGIGSLNMKLFVKKILHRLMHHPTFFSMPRRGSPAILTEGLMTEIKQILSNLRGDGCAISTMVVISVGNGVLSSRCPDKMAKNGGNIAFSIKWARNILKSMNWVKRRGYNRKKSNESVSL